MEPTVPIPGLNAYIADEVDLSMAAHNSNLRHYSAVLDHAAFDRGSSEIYDMMVQRQVDHLMYENMMVQRQVERLVYENKNLYRELKELRLSAELQSACGQ